MILLLLFTTLLTLDPFTTPILPCSRVVTSYDQAHHRFIVEATTPIKSLRVTKSSGATFQHVSGNRAIVTMRITDERNFYIYMDMEDECGQWKPSMQTLQP